ncbi:MAG: phosphatase PAP2 family protein [Gemmatimonadetes bacterium]|nr:phosphatase PAP2 family protein [Gemmatimonadota bacterium]
MTAQGRDGDLLLRRSPRARIGARAVLAVLGVLASLSWTPASLIAQSPPPDPDRDDLLDRPHGFVAAFVSDAWASTIAPFQLRGNDAWALGGVLAIGTLLYAADGPLSADIVESADGGLGRHIESLGETLDPMGLMGKTNPYWIAGMLVSDLAGWEGGELVFKELLFSHWIAGLGRQGMRRVLGRRRPDEGADPRTFDPGEGTALPSGHMATFTQVAAILSHHIDRWPATVALYGLAGAMAYERVSSEKHWASDAWIGAAWGWGVAQVVMARREESAGMGSLFGRGPSLAVDPQTGGIGLTFRFSGWRP